MNWQITSFISGLLFSVGLAVSGMTNPKNVTGFLDITGDWKPALMFVMVGAILVYATAYRIIMLMFPKPVFEKEYHLPAATSIDKKLIIGSVIFGIGWGIGGYCPGPALTSLGANARDALIFTLFMFAGMWAQKIWDARSVPNQN
ncbi:MAG: hypothetical protein K0R29_1750 [Pseudobdellovibrio sp.]|nr:hypothetical protein [Pseudobdellovibrio sp.]